MDSKLTLTSKQISDYSKCSKERGITDGTRVENVLHNLLRLYTNRPQSSTRNTSIIFYLIFVCLFLTLLCVCGPQKRQSAPMLPTRQIGSSWGK